MEDSTALKRIDRCSFEIGMINCFVEMVACGVKRLALSPPLSPEDYERIKPWSEKIVAGFGMKSWLEKRLIATALQSDAFIAGKWVILYYKTDDVLDSYKALKEKRALLDTGKGPEQHALTAISREFMQLLSYPEQVIDEKLSGRTKDPFILIPD
ncbi:hypothetical protein [Desulfobacula sp.]|uniref:hypothetical protein n=1 Tax=Desulfobacula sp. TaxID=2593537 RepID=UPI00261B93E6|nr:hypothetical protein [Desulfobacula sp.]